MMPTSTLIVTTSWDDGHPADMRVAEILSKYNMAGTFYVPCRNREGKNVMSRQDLKSLAKVYELGGHTMDHVVLTTLDSVTAAKQIKDSKAWLEDLTSGSVNGFCYPLGKYNRAIKELTKGAGFKYARTTKSFCSSVGYDYLAMGTTLQFFPHRKSVYLKNFLRSWSSGGRISLLTTALSSSRLGDRIQRIANVCAVEGGIFHLWGHSSEINEYGLWAELEDVMKYLSQAFKNGAFLDNSGVYNISKVSLENVDRAIK